MGKAKQTPAPVSEPDVLPGQETARPHLEIVRPDVLNARRLAALMARVTALNWIAGRDMMLPQLREMFERKRAQALEDPEKLADFVELATDEECLVVLFHKSLEAPFNSVFHTIYLHVFNRVMRECGVGVPGEMKTCGNDFSSYHERELREFKRKIRNHQLKRLGFT